MAVARRGTVLLLEDHPGIRGMISQHLRKKAFLVLEAPDREAMLNQAASFGGPIELLFADLSNVSGGAAELLRTFRGMRPQCRILVTAAALASGGVWLPEVAGCPGVELLRWPFSFDDMERRVRQLTGAYAEPVRALAAAH